MDVHPDEFIKKAIVRTSMYTIVLVAGLAMLADKQGWSMMVPILATFFIWGTGFYFALKEPVIQAHKRSQDIDREVLFAGRFILIKLHSGKPLVNAIDEAAKSYGVASKYFQEIMRDIELGTPLEEAIQNAMTFTSSKSFRKILFQIHNALKLGMDVTQSLEAVLEDITQNQIMQIERYGKKLSSVTLIYMIIAVVLPSLGMTILTVIMAFTSIRMDLTRYLVVIFLLVLINFTFITVFRGIRPKVNI